MNCLSIPEWPAILMFLLVAVAILLRMWWLDFVYLKQPPAPSAAKQAGDSQST